jgi:hypothetical protein
MLLPAAATIVAALDLDIEEVLSKSIEEGFDLD